MKDEELADKYAEEYFGKKIKSCLQRKAGRPQWHDLRKNKNDLPNDKEYVLVYTNLTNYYVAEKVDNHFMSKGWGFIPMSTVIAWCEIPTFDKE